MAESATNLVDHVLPPVPLRQFVLTLPFELRARLAFDAALLGAVNRVFAVPSPSCSAAPATSD